MAYDVKNLATLGHLKALAQQAKANDDRIEQKVTSLETQVDGLVTAGGEPNKIDAVKVNGTALEITEKAVDIGASISAAVAAADHLKRKIVDSVEVIDVSAADAAQYIYMIAKPESADGDKYDEYMVIGGEVEKVGDWAVDLSGYVTVEEGKGLSANDFTDEEKTKLAGLALATDQEVTDMLGEIFSTAEENHSHSKEQVGEAAASHTHTAEDVGALSWRDVKQDFHC